MGSIKKGITNNIKICDMPGFPPVVFNFVTVFFPCVLQLCVFEQSLRILFIKLIHNKFDCIGLFKIHILGYLYRICRKGAVLYHICRKGGPIMSYM